MKNGSDSLSFSNRLFKIGLPMLGSHLLFSTMAFVDNIMIGRLGKTAIAGVSLANELFFVLMVISFGITSGAAIFTAQFWGKKDVKSIHGIIGICYRLTFGLSTLFFIAAMFFPDFVLGLYSKDLEVIRLGKEYLSIIAFTYPLLAIAMTLSTVLRSTEEVKIPLIVSTIGIGLNSILNLLLIFGIGPFPALGIKGAAIATLIARIVEVSILIIVIYSRKMVVASKLKELLDIPKGLWKKYFGKVTPVIINEVTWATGMTACIAIYSRMGTDQVAAYKMAAVVTDLFFVFFLSSGNAAAIILGNLIGAGKPELAQDFGKKFLKLSLVMSIVLAVIIISLSSLFPLFFKVSDEIRKQSQLVLIVFAFVITFKGLNMHIIIGFLRSGGDTFAAMMLDMLGMWAWAVPMGAVTGLIFKWPLHYVYAVICLEEVFKLWYGLYRFRSGKWINDVTKGIRSDSPEVDRVNLNDPIA